MLSFNNFSNTHIYKPHLEEITYLEKGEFCEKKPFSKRWKDWKRDGKHIKGDESNRRIRRKLLHKVMRTIRMLVVAGTVAVL